MKKTLLIILTLHLAFGASAQFQTPGGGDYETQTTVNGVAIGTVGGVFGPALYVRGDLLNNPNSEVFETVGLSSATNAWRLKTINGSTITEMFRVLAGNGNNAYVDATAGSLNLRATANDNAIIFHTVPDMGSLGERMRITSGGFVGISTNGPASKLHLNGFGAATYFTVTNTASPTGFKFGVAASTDVAEIRQEEDAAMIF